MKIDLIMPFHEINDYFYKAIHSIYESVSVEINLILVDDRVDRSTTLKVKYDKLIVSQGVGYSRALKMGLAEVNADFFAFQDSDDLTVKNRLNSQISNLLSSNADISICGLRRVGTRGLRTLIQPPLFTDNTCFKLLNLLGSINSNSSWVCRKTILSLPEFMPENFQSIDWATTLGLPDSVIFSLTKDRMYLYRQHASQLTKTSKYLNKAFSEIYPLWRKFNEELNLPSLSQWEAAMIAAPWSSSSHRCQFPIEWIQEFFKLPAIHNSRDYRKITFLLLRRIKQNHSLSIREKMRLSQIILNT